MGKKLRSAAAATAAAATAPAVIPSAEVKGKGRASEIDDIFAAKTGRSSGRPTEAPRALSNEDDSAKPVRSSNGKSVSTGDASLTGDGAASSSKKKKKRKLQKEAPSSGALDGAAAALLLPSRPDAASSKASSSQATSKPAPVTVVDTSNQLLLGERSRKRLKSSSGAHATPPTTNNNNSNNASSTRSKLSTDAAAKAHEEDALFRDSRGTSTRKRTEEGFTVYTEQELGMGDEGGDTPLCPFDCECCF